MHIPTIDQLIEAAIARPRLQEIFVNCPGCCDIVPVHPGFNECFSCYTFFDVQLLMDELAEGKETSFCGECHYSQQATVVAFQRRHLCLNCFALYQEQEINTCDCCGESVAGETRSRGCFMSRAETDMCQPAK
jgi:hypothetical protein